MYDILYGMLWTLINIILLPSVGTRLMMSSNILTSKTNNHYFVDHGSSGPKVCMKTNFT